MIYNSEAIRVHIPPDPEYPVYTILNYDFIGLEGFYCAELDF